MMDPPRPEAKEAVEKCKKAGIRSIMITGDHKSTAVAIARELGILDEQNLALSGAELDQMSDQDLEGRVAQISVYSRVSAEHKLRVVRAWRKGGKVVAMTGDGVNDAPAVKEADIGIATGITGTAVTKEVADMVITDDNFASIVSAVEEGRGIYENIKKSIYYLLSCNTSEILVMLIASLLGIPFPLYPVQILWVNIATDGLPAIALGMDPIEKGIMERPPRPREEAIINKDFIFKMLFQGLLMSFCVLAVFIFVLYVENAELSRARSVAFTALVLIQLVHVFNCRSERTSMFKLGFLSNPKLMMATLLSLILQAAIVYSPFLSRIFKVERLSLFDWMLCLLVSFIPLAGIELYKIWVSKKLRITPFSTPA
jgi:Ca2+-transporting ATPase